MLYINKILVVLSLLFLSTNVYTDTVSQKISQGRELFKRKQYSESVKVLSSFKSKGVYEANRLFHLARSLGRLKRYKEAEKANSLAYSINPDLFAAYFNNACITSLAKNSKMSLHYIKMLDLRLKNNLTQRARYHKGLLTDSDLSFVRKHPSFRTVLSNFKYGMPENEYVAAKQHMDLVRNVSRMTNDLQSRKLANKFEMDIQNVSWEDTGRSKNSSVGPNISDLTISVESKDPLTQRKKQTAMPVIRYPNFSDKTADVSPRDLTLLVGNEKGQPLKRISLQQFLENPTDYLHDPKSWKGLKRSLIANRDKQVLVSAQAAFLPVPRKGKASFNPVIYNYQSSANDPAVLTVLATPEGTSVTLVTDAGDRFGQTLYYNDNGKAAVFTGERKSEALERRKNGGKIRKQSGASVADESLNLVMLIQVPLKTKKRSTPQPVEFYEDDEESFEGDEGAFYDDAEEDFADDSFAADESVDLEEAVISFATANGQYREIGGLEITRDERFPVRVTIQFYQATTSSRLDHRSIKRLAQNIRSVYNNANAIGSLVTGGATGRITEYDGATVQNESWWNEHYHWCDSSDDIATKDLSKVYTKYLGPNFRKKPVTELYLRNLLFREGLLK